MTITIDVNEARQLSQLVALAKAGEVIIAEGDTPVARLTAIVPASLPRQRIAGLHQGAVWMSEDFDDPLPDEFWMGEE